MLPGLEHYIDSHLTQAQARVAIGEKKITVALYINRDDAYSVVHSHPYHELILPVAGSDVVYAVDGGLYSVRLGELVYFAAEQYHAGRYHVTAESSERLVVQIDDGIWQAAKCYAGKAYSLGRFSILPSAVAQQWDLRGLLERMAQSAMLDASCRDAMLTAETAQLQILIAQAAQKQALAAQGVENALVARAAAYLQQHYQEQDLTAEALAKHCYVSREHLSRAFRTYTMETVHGYLTSLRMQHCRRLLAKGSPILEACDESGFANYSSFLKAFRKLYGMTPAAYRAGLRKKE